MSRRFGAYILESELAQGGQGSVWRARHEATGQTVALKLLTSGGESAALRFAQEARVLARLSHPNVVAVFDHGEVEGRPFLACELVAGEDLAACLRKGLPQPGWAAQVLVAVARALQHCHERGVVHRDVKPQNILVEAQGERPVLVDFGLVKRDPAQLGLTSIDDRGELSLSGSIKGTPEYMSPEQIHPKHGTVGPATDVYGLGATLYFLLSGQAPFSAESLPALLRKVTRQAPPPLDPARVPPALAHVCLQALAKDPRARFPTAEAFAQALRATGLLTDGSDVRRTTSGRILAGLQAPARAGQRVGPYSVVRELGRGAMGVVFEARADDGQVVALKLLSGKLDDRMKKRFEREVKALSALDHPHVVRFAGASSEGAAPHAAPWLAMEFVKGRDLQAHIEAQGRLSPDETARLVSQIARGVAHAHEREVMHRDLKPANVLVREDGTAVVTDFGLARSLEASRFTRTGDTVGTLAYMAPEQVRGQREEGPPSDVWAIGAILYRCLTGEPPFSAESALGLAAQICEGAVRRPRGIDGKVPPDLESVALACLRREPAARPTADEVADALEARTGLGGGDARGRRALVAALLVAAGLVLVAGILVQRRRAGGAATGDPTATEQGGGPGVGGGPAVDASALDPSALDPSALDPSALDPSWQLAWSLGHGPSPVLRPAELWTGTDGRTAAPLARVLAGDEAALAAAFLGEARALGDGRVSVRYVDLQRVLRFEPAEPQSHIVRTRPDVLDLDVRGGRALLHSTNDASGAQVWVGAARWTRVRVALRAWLEAHVDKDEVQVRVGTTTGAGACVLELEGRARQASVSPFHVVPTVPFALEKQPVDLVFEPLAQREALVLGDVRRDALPGVARPGAGPVRLNVLEAHLGIERLEVSGRPARPDVPALAAIEGDAPTHARVSATFAEDEARDDVSGGPLVAFVREDGSPALSLELDGALLVLRRGAACVRAVPVPAGARASGGVLVLERRGDVVFAALGPAGSPGATRFEVLLPLPVGGSLRAAYGSAAARVRFDAVVVHHGPTPDAERAGWDRAGLEAAAASDGASPRAAWRAGALRCARVTDPALTPRALLGDEGRRARRRAASEAADGLERAADALAASADDPTFIADALARALLARVAAADADGAVSATRRLVGAVGSARAFAAVDALEVGADGGPRTVSRLIAGYCNVTDVDVQTAALRAAQLLAPGDEAQICMGLGMLERNRKPPPDPATPEGRAAHELALGHFQRARLALQRAPSADQLSLLDGYEGDTLMLLGRLPEALERWDRVVVSRPTYGYGWLRRGECLERSERLEEALESYLGQLAHAPRQQPELWRRCVSIARTLSETGRCPGLSGTALVLAHDWTGELRYQGEGLTLAHVTPTSPKDHDLASYVLARSESSARPEVRDGARDTRVLALARAGDRRAKEALAEAARRDPLVRHLAMLDATLAPLLR